MSRHLPAHLHLRASLLFSMVSGLVSVWPCFGGQLRVGVAKAPITPSEPGQFLAGYGANRPAEGVHDDIWCRAMAIGDGENTIVIVSLDLLGLFFADSREIARGVEGVPEDNIVITCTHVHSAPDVIGLWGPNPATSGVDREYLAMVKRRARQVINAAVSAEAMMPARLRFATATAPPGTGYNARERELIDRDISIMQAQTLDGQPIATLVNYACHPEVLTTPSRLVTSDYVHYLRDEMESNATGDVVFVNGALGGMVTPEVSANTFEEAERVGRALGRAALEAMAQAEEVTDAEVRLKRAVIALPFANPGLAAAAAAGVIARKPSEEGTIETTVVAGRIGPAQFATLPGEALPKVGLAVKRLMSAKYKFFFGLGDDELGYLLHAEAVDADLYKYEQSMSANKHAVPLLIKALTPLIGAMR